VLADVRAFKAELGERVDHRTGTTSADRTASMLDTSTFANGLDKAVELREQRAIRRRRYIRHKGARPPPCSIRMFPMIDWAVALNLWIAKLDLTSISPTLLVCADEVIE
jgi:hypothetical protein